MSLSFRHAAFTVVLLFVAFTAHAKTASEIYEQAARSTVVVENINDKGEIAGLGSGVVLPNGSVVTNCHVIKDASQLKVRSNKNKFPAVLQFSDWDRDVCSLFIVGLNAPAVVVGSTKTLKVGAKVFAIGAPKGFELTLSDGIVSSLREFEGGHIIQTNAAISPGSSGGGLFDENGALVGLTTFFLKEGQSLNFAVPVEWVTELVTRSINAERRAEAEQKVRAERERVLAEQADIVAKIRRNLKAELEKAVPSKVVESVQSLESLKADLELAEKKRSQEKPQEAVKPETKRQIEKVDTQSKLNAEVEKAEADKAAAIGREVAEYKAKIIAKIRRNIIMLPDIPSNVIAEFEVTLLPGGMVLNAKLVKPSGSAAYDSAVERAIKKAEPLPVPPDVTLFDMFRELRLKFSPIVKYDRLPSCPGTYETATWTNCFGVYTYSSGAKYVGEFKDDKFNGQGTLTLPDGTKYVGEFKDDKFNGQEQDAKKKQVDNAIADHKANDFENAVKRARLAAAQGDAEAQYNLGVMFHKGEGVAQDYVEAAKWYRLAAAQGNANAPNNLGVIYGKGQGVTQDYAEEVKWYRLAAVRGNVTSQLNLGDLYIKGESVTQDYAEAMKWLRLAAAQGNVSAQNNLGWMYHNGQGVTQDYAEAVRLYRLAAAQGHATSQNNLGNMYYKGQGVVQNYAEAAKWYRLAAIQGYSSAQFNLGLMYKKGQGVTQDYTEALKWHRLSAAQGVAGAQNNLGLMYHNGEGVTQDYIRAHMWLNLGAASGDADAVKNRDIVAGKMTSQQIAQAQIMARDCQQKNFKGCE
ncbi:MAG: cell envelope integrity protein TolA [Candidatus Nitrotoga sp.]|nr:cell envelope integrity protein TolA [Candidatus Nitrotoga sp.]MDP1679519.1 cell envelope integrity protein TolA [Candidatus Nitrotoga sp.]